MCCFLFCLGKITEPAVAINGKIVGLYFGRQDCITCRNFTRTLRKPYNDLKDQNLPFEIIFISSDQDAKNYDKAAKFMPW